MSASRCRTWLVMSQGLVSKYDAGLAGPETEIIPLPVSRLVGPRDPKRLLRALRAREHDLLLLTSANAVTFVEPKQVAGWTAACVGIHTALAAERVGIDVAFVGRAGARALSSRLIDEAPAAQRLLFLRGRHALGGGPDRLRAAGRVVDEVEAYVLERNPDINAAVLAAPDPEQLVVGSPRAADILKEVLGDRFAERLSGARIVTLGMTTASHLARLGVEGATPTRLPGPEGVRQILAGSA